MRTGATSNSHSMAGAHWHSKPLLFFKLQYIFIKVLGGRILFLQEWVCLLSFFLFETISFVPPFSFLNFNGPESGSLPEFEHSLKSQRRVHFLGLSPTPPLLGPGRLCGANQGLVRSVHMLPVSSFTHLDAT